MSFDVALTTDTKQPGCLFLSSESLEKHEGIISLISDHNRWNEDNSQYPSNPPKVNLLIKTPQVLSALGVQLSTLPLILTLLNPQNSPSPNPSPSTLSFPVSSITTLSISILAPISSSSSLTPEEKNGAIDGPVMSSLVQAWRDAFRCIPAQHHIECVRFDMACSQPCELRHVVRLLQEVSTGMYVKTKGKTGRELAFDVIGCENKRKWLLASLPGKTESGVEG